MVRRTPEARTAHTKQKPKPRLVTKAHRLEQDEERLSQKAAAREMNRSKRAAHKAR